MSNQDCRLLHTKLELFNLISLFIQSFTVDLLWYSSQWTASIYRKETNKQQTPTELGMHWSKMTLTDFNEEVW